MNDVRFAEPVFLQLPQSGPRKVSSSFEALECLEQQWPVWVRGRSWRAAYRACTDVLEGWRDARHARKAFVRAAKKAGLVASGVQPVQGRRESPALYVQSRMRPSLNSAG